MPSSDPRQRLADIIENADAIVSYTAGLDFDTYRSTRMLQDAVERCLQRISETARKLGSEMDDRYPEVPWRAIRVLGNILRHDYHVLDHERIWLLVQTDLLRLRTTAEAALQSMDERLGPP